jgi:hypothetical protein
MLTLFVTSNGEAATDACDASAAAKTNDAVVDKNLLTRVATTTTATKKKTLT